MIHLYVNYTINKKSEYIMRKQILRILNQIVVNSRFGMVFGDIYRIGIFCR